MALANGFDVRLAGGFPEGRVCSIADRLAFGFPGGLASHPWDLESFRAVRSVGSRSDGRGFRFEREAFLARVGLESLRLRLLKPLRDLLLDMTSEYSRPVNFTRGNVILIKKKRRSIISDQSPFFEREELYELPME